MIHRKGSALWNGSTKEGQGTVSTESGILSATPYSFKTRFAQGKGTNPEELLAAAHAGCYSMAFSLFLGNAGFTPESIETTADVILESKEGGFAITQVHLVTKVKVPNLKEASFQELAKSAKENCPVSKLFNAEITLEATLV